jgi:TRAP-type mannitol/chloroaromatic compound transport system substrate-binding protein
MTMKRRDFLTTTATGAAATALAAPAIAQPAGSVKWRIQTSWPKSLDAMHGAVDVVAKRVLDLTDGKFEIRVFAGGEVVPALQVYDAVSAGTIEGGHTLTSFYIGKRPALAFDAGVAFGMNTRQQFAWMYYGGGLPLMREIFKKDNLVQFPCGNVGVQMGGFYRKEIKTVEDLNGLKFRIGGLGGMVLAKLGVVPQQIATSDIYPALEKGTIDAAEWIGPYDDEKLGLHKVAKFYYYPGWWEGSAMVTMIVNATAWEALPPAYKAAFEVACNEQCLLMQANYDDKNPPALRRLVAAGVQLKPFPKPVLDACYKAAFQTFDELAAKDADFKRVYDAWLKFIEESNLWFRVAEYNLDSYRFSTALPKK